MWYTLVARIGLYLPLAYRDMTHSVCRDRYSTFLSYGTFISHALECTLSIDVILIWLDISTGGAGSRKGEAMRGVAGAHGDADNDDGSTVISGVCVCDI